MIQAGIKRLPAKNQTALPERVGLKNIESFCHQMNCENFTTNIEINH
jgi:hypothetical protein